MKSKTTQKPDKTSCGIIKIKAIPDYPILYANQVFRVHYGNASSLREIVHPKAYPGLIKEITNHLGAVPARFKLGFQGIGETKTRNYIRFDYVPGQGEPVLYGMIQNAAGRKQQSGGLNPHGLDAVRA